MESTMTITRALAELKTLDARIHKGIQELKSIGLTTGKRVIAGYKNNEEYEEKVKSNFQSIVDLIKRRDNIKAAIVKSNAENVVKVGDKTYTVAEAIERKNTGINYRNSLLKKLKEDYAQAIRDYEYEEERTKERLDSHLNTIFGRDVKIDKNVQKEESDIFLERNQPKLIDPLELKDVIKQLEAEIDEFMLNVDAALSEANTLNKITI